MSFEKINGYDDSGNPIIDSTDTVTEYQDGYLPLMLSDRIICLKAFDAAGSNTLGSHKRNKERIKTGSNYWGDSNIRSWLNSNESAGNVNWLCGNSPSNGSFAIDQIPYDNEDGFLKNFKDEEKAKILMVTQKNIVGYPEYRNHQYTSGNSYHQFSYTIDSAVCNYESAYSKNVTDNMFLLDVKQVYTTYINSNVLGNNYYAGYPTDLCIKNVNYSHINFSTDHIWSYWLRTPFADDRDDAGQYSRAITTIPNVDYQIAYCSTVGVRPAFFLNIDCNIPTLGNGSKDNPYYYMPPTYTLSDKGEINKSGSRAGMYYTLSLSSAKNSVTMTVDDTDFTINNLGDIDVTTSLSFILLGKRALGDIPDIQKVTGYGGVEYKEE